MQQQITPLTKEKQSRRWWEHMASRLILSWTGVAAMTALIYFLQPGSSFASVSMLYFLVVLLTALWLGRISAVLASVLSFLTFNWFFVEPRYHLTVQNPGEWYTLCMFLLTATVTGQLTALLKTRAVEAYRSQKEAEALADATWAVASELNVNQALAKVLQRLTPAAQFESAAVIGLDPDADCRIIAQYPLEATKAGLPAGESLKEAALKMFPGDWHERPLFLPVNVEDKTLAILCLNTELETPALPPQKRVVHSLINQVALVLQREKLLKAEAKAQALSEADQLKTTLLRMVSHDFRSPLTSIKASVGSLLRGSWNPESERALLETVEQEADRLNRMVGNILDLSRLEVGAWQPKREITPVAEVIGAALDAFSPRDNGRIQVFLENNLPDMWVDSVQMTQVLTNLLDNALKYSVENPVELKAHSEEKELIIEIMDRGIGLPPDAERIFEPFFRAPQLKEGPVPGLGIGLAICRGLVEANGGCLTAFNRQGGGAVFRIALAETEQTRGGDGK